MTPTDPLPLQNTHPLWTFFKSVTRSFTDRRFSLWIALFGLVVALLVTLVWLAGRYEASQYQAELDRDTADAVTDIRNGFSRHIVSLQTLQLKSLPTNLWQAEVSLLLSQNRAWLRVERRDLQGVILDASASPFQPNLFDAQTRMNEQAEIVQTCLRSKRLNGPAYSRSYFVPQANGIGLEVMEMCLPFLVQGRAVGFTLLTYGLQEILATELGETYGRRNEISFIEPDGTRLAVHGSLPRAKRLFTATQLLDLPGTTLMLRMDGRRATPDGFTNILPALVLAMSIALVSVLVLLVKDSRRRLKAERDLADALAFRKAMEDSLVTGLRARDLKGRITYAFLDVSEQRRIEELSRSSQERLQATARLATVGEMASLLSHELNQPLAAISSYATGSLNLLRHPEFSDTPPPLSDLQMAFERISEQAGRAGKVINSVHDFVRRRDQDKEVVSPQAIIDAVMPLVQLQAHKLQVRIETKLDVRLSPILCDRTMVEQVLLNLARNGMQAMDYPHCHKRLLTLQVKRATPGESHGWVEFSVIDMGIGISPDIAQQLFTPFFTTKAEGMGLGLSLCRTVVEQHGGRLEFEAQEPCGTLFRFTLPTAPEL
ncbi:MAG: ATP-binding protein [Limnohabitans sp.]|nr:ATP-binding protein [Limnohabitans sp.]